MSYQLDRGLIVLNEHLLALLVLVLVLGLLNSVSVATRHDKPGLILPNRAEIDSQFHTYQVASPLTSLLW